MVYASAHLSLAVLENLVHIDGMEDWPADRRYWEYELDDDLVERRGPDDLPGDWATDPGVTRRIGDDFLAGGRTLALLVPSVVVPIEFNVLVNPEHADRVALALLHEADFALDARLRAGI